MNETSFIRRFEAGEIQATEFGHEDHVRAAWEMLRCYSFMEATSRYCTSIENLARSAGAPEKFNVTITLAFMSLIAEKMETGCETDFDRFYRAHPELRKNTLGRWYSDRRLHTPLARKIFLLPEPSRQQRA